MATFVNNPNTSGGYDRFRIDARARFGRKLVSWVERCYDGRYFVVLMQTSPTAKADSRYSAVVNDYGDLVAVLA